MLVFRDRLRTNPEDRRRYLRAKRKLARKHWKYAQNYADAKPKVVESIIKRAHLTHQPRVDGNNPRVRGLLSFIAHELLELLERDLESRGVAVREVGSS
jgi:hypothetical protein